MKIIIVGAGRTCNLLVASLAKRNNDITVIDMQKDLVDDLTDRYNVNGVVGSGAAKETLEKAGAAYADILIALTPVDEINLLSCMQAKSVGTLHTMARVSQPDLDEERESLEREHGIDFIFNPKYDMAEAVALSIGLPGVAKHDGVFEGFLQMVTVSITDSSPLVGKTIMEIRKEINTLFFIGTVIRDGKLFVPLGDFVIESGDVICILSSVRDMMKTLHMVGVVKHHVRDVMIAGGGITSEYLVEMLLEQKKNITLIDADIDRCREVMEKYPEVQVVYKNGELSEIMEEEGIDHMDAVVALTDSDEENLVTSLFAWSKNIPSILTEIEAPAHLKLLHRVNLDITLSSSEISVDKLIRFIHNCEASDAPNQIESYCSVSDNMAEVIQFTAGEDLKNEGVAIRDLLHVLKKGVLVATIIRNGEQIIPLGDQCIKKGDKVIIISDKKNHIENLNEIFK
ncbi:MAG: Trk system potassium transporter TrkA [Lachnospiraceae bacterium]|nr:Trk system potassium transporter TrkA [Lachnospiraceae bacterium]